MKIFKPTHAASDDNRAIIRQIKWMLAAVLLVSILFAGYYIWDRYVHVGDMSPTELGIDHQLRIVEQNPNDVGARLNLSQSYIEAGNYDEAIRHAQTVLKAYPDNPGALILMGVAYSKSGNAQSAVKYLEQFAAIRRKSDDPSLDKVLEAALYYLGDNYLKIKSPDKAVPVLVEALAIDETDADAMLLLGDAYAATGQHKLAIGSYENTVRFVPDYTEAYTGMAASYRALKMPAYEQYALGMQAFSRRDFNRAQTLLEKSVADLQTFAPAYLGLALTYEQLGKLDAAQTYAARAVDLDPKNFAANNLLARLKANKN